MMTITIECTHCGTKFAGEPQYLGRRIRCTRCREVFRVPDGASSVPDDFDYSLQSGDDNETTCPYCHGRVAPGQVLCMNCGYHFKLKKNVSATHVDEAPEEPETIRDFFFGARIDFGVLSIPAWPIAAGVAAFALVTFLTYLVVPGLAALMLLAVGLGLTAVGNMWIIVVASQESFLLALAVWFVPIVWWYYVITHIEDLWVPLGIALTGLLMLVTGLAILIPDDSFNTAALAMAWFDLKVR